MSKIKMSYKPLQFREIEGYFLSKISTPSQQVQSETNWNLYLKTDTHISVHITYVLALEERLGQRKSRNIPERW